MSDRQDWRKIKLDDECNMCRRGLNLQTLPRRPRHLSMSRGSAPPCYISRLVYFLAADRVFRALAKRVNPWQHSQMAAVNEELITDMPFGTCISSKKRKRHSENAVDQNDVPVYDLKSIRCSA